MDGLCKQCENPKLRTIHTCSKARGKIDMKCMQCANPGLKGIHTCDKSKTYIKVARRRYLEGLSDEELMELENTQEFNELARRFQKLKSENKELWRDLLGPGPGEFGDGS